MNAEGFALIPCYGRPGIVGYAKVDAEYAQELRGFRWNLQLGYAKRTSKRIAMHRQILQDWDMSHDIDHINGDRLDNRKINLRPATRSQNRHRCRKRISSSQFKGVGRKNNLWYVQIMVNWKKLSGGYFKNEIEAAKRYDELARLHFGVFAKVNFPERSLS